MWLKLIPSYLSMSSRTTFGEKAGTAHTLHFTVHLVGQRLALETGEIFQNPEYASIRGYEQTAIDANLSLHLVSDGRDLSRTNVMTYVEGVTNDDHHAPPSIHFDVSIPASDHSLLLNNIRGGITPSSVRVELRHELYGKGSPVDYEGGEMHWRNAKNRRVALESINIDYRVIGADDGDGAVANTAKSSTPKIDAASVAIAATMADLERAFTKTKTLIVTVIIVASAVLYFALR
ncbi:MAG TPA: hypothetical protein VMT72_14430 [Pseudolabrys sp.]|nr:hypothetical protein [Pseudolabrys sp.]